MIQARHSNPLNLRFVFINQSVGNSWICKSEVEKRNYTVTVNSQRCDDWQCSLKYSNCNACVHTFICSCVDFLLCFTICKHIHVVHQYRERNERKIKICEEPIRGHSKSTFVEEEGGGQKRTGRGWVLACVYVCFF